MEIVKIGGFTFKKYIHRNEIEDRVKDIATTINNEYKNKKPLLVGVLKGCFRFMAELHKHIDIETQITFMKVKSYDGTTTTGEITKHLEVLEIVDGRDIIIIEDIVDTGHTSEYIIKNLKKKNPKSIKLCTLLYKPNAFLYKPHEPNYIGFSIDNEFVIGYGMDYNEDARGLNDIYIKIDE